jgi:His/Glu/Gln/Arg/opine family amino acid ABC transporter permease subunit
LVFLYQYAWNVIPVSAGPLAGGLVLTIEVSVLALAGSLLLGLPIAFMRAAPVRLVSLAGYVYIQTFRSLSLFVYVLWIYFGIAAFLGINLNALATGVIALSLLNSAYIAEILRSAIQAVDAGQREAARSLGMSTFTTLRTVVAPQAWRIAVPAVVNQFVDIIKDSSILAVIGAGDLMYRTIQQVSFYDRPFELYSTVGLVYLALVVITARLAARLERRLKRHLA